MAGFFVSISWLPVAIALQILTTCSTQEYVEQSHDQIQAFSLGQTRPRQNQEMHVCRVVKAHEGASAFFIFLCKVSNKPNN